jgi:hypothetical protein
VQSARLHNTQHKPTTCTPPRPRDSSPHTPAPLTHTRAAHTHTRAFNHSPPPFPHTHTHTHTQNGAAVAQGGSLWQVTEPLPLLSAEPALAEALLEEAQGLGGLAGSADTAVNALLNDQQVRV